MQSFVRTVTAENYESFVEENPDKNKILLFTDRKTTAPLFKSLSKTYKDKLVFGEVKKSETSIYENYGITETPALLARLRLRPGGLPAACAAERTAAHHQCTARHTAHGVALQ